VTAPDVAPHPGAVLGLLADEQRLRVLAAVALGAGSEDAVTAAAGLERRLVRRALDRLATVGLVVEEDDGRLCVAMEPLRLAARRASHMRPTVTPEDVGATPQQATVLRGFFDDGRLTAIPVARGKRLVVLDWLAQLFEPGKVYPERDVNVMLVRFHPDVAALRRYLVDEEFLERRGGFYWRAGGTFELEGAD
jgi:hypothetical protein